MTKKMDDVVVIRHKYSGEFFIYEEDGPNGPRGYGPMQWREVPATATEWR
jgi:hypothetical protein